MPPGAAVFADAGDDGVALLIGDDAGLYRLAPGGQGVDDGAIQLAVVAHGEGARDGGGGEDKLMHARAGRGFVLQLQALVYAEAVLFVDDDKGEAGVADLFLKDGVRADDEVGAAVGNCLQAGAFVGGGHFAGQRFHAHREVAEQAADVGGVLLGEQLGRHHEHRLLSGGDGLQTGGQRYHGFAAANVALHQAQHRRRLCEVGGDLGADAALRGGERIR